MPAIAARLATVIRRLKLPRPRASNEKTETSNNSTQLDLVSPLRCLAICLSASLQEEAGLTLSDRTAQIWQTPRPMAV